MPPMEDNPLEVPLVLVVVEANGVSLLEAYHQTAVLENLPVRLAEGRRRRHGGSCFLAELGLELARGSRMRH